MQKIEKKEWLWVMNIQLYRSKGKKTSIRRYTQSHWGNDYTKDLDLVIRTVLLIPNKSFSIVVSKDRR